MQRFTAARTAGGYTGTMKATTATCAVILSALLFAGAGPAPPQDEAEVPPLVFRGESSVSWVLVPVTLRRAPGTPLPARLKDLRPEDFRLSVDGHAVGLTSFEAGADAPVRLFYVQDLSGSMANAGRLEASRAALRCFLERSRPGDELALVTFASGETRLDVPFTAEHERLAAALASWQAYGTTALHDAVARLPELRVDERGLKRAAVLVTDGGDNASALDPARARDAVRAAELPVYVLDLGGRRPASGPVDPASSAHLLRLLAEATGGGYRAVDAPRLAAACAEISEELRYQYVLGFETGDSGDPSYHAIHVEVDDAGVVASHRRGYLGRPPLATTEYEP